MGLDEEIVRWIEYSICEEAMILYPQSNSTSSTFYQFCDRLRNSIVREDLSDREVNILYVLIKKANRQYRLSDNEMGVICANFFCDRKWVRYVKAIKLMEGVRWKLP